MTATNKKRIVQGEDTVIRVLLKDGEGRAFDLTGQTALEAFFVGTAGQFSTTSVAVVGSDDCGVVDITLSETDTLGLEPGIQPVELQIDKGTARTLVQMADSIDVRERLT